jgi:hypothetical protein
MRGTPFPNLMREQGISVPSTPTPGILPGEAALGGE